ncbi:hypothetical protein [Mucilaginibacter celer]|nr:hypothetical protein [Mucilaginibacter celer]
MKTDFVLGIEADTGLWLRPVQYERKARAAGNTLVQLAVRSRQFAVI